MAPGIRHALVRLRAGTPHSWWGTEASQQTARQPQGPAVPGAPPRTTAGPCGDRPEKPKRRPWHSGARKAGAGLSLGPLAATCSAPCLHPRQHPASTGQLQSSGHLSNLEARGTRKGSALWEETRRGRAGGGEAREQATPGTQACRPARDAHSWGHGPAPALPPDTSQGRAVLRGSPRPCGLGSALCSPQPPRQWGPFKDRRAGWQEA